MVVEERMCSNNIGCMILYTWEGNACLACMVAERVRQNLPVPARCVLLLDDSRTQRTVQKVAAALLCRVCEVVPILRPLTRSGCCKPDGLSRRKRGAARDAVGVEVGLGLGLGWWREWGRGRERGEEHSRELEPSSSTIATAERNFTKRRRASCRPHWAHYQRWMAAHGSDSVRSWQLVELPVDGGELHEVGRTLNSAKPKREIA